MTDDNLSPVARACIGKARAVLATVNQHLTPDRSPYVPPPPDLPAGRVQGEEGE